MSHERLTLWWLQWIAQRDLANADLELARLGKQSDTVGAVATEIMRQVK